MWALAAGSLPTFSSVTPFYKPSRVGSVFKALDQEDLGRGEHIGHENKRTHAQPSMGRSDGLDVHHKNTRFADFGVRNKKPSFGFASNRRTRSERIFGIETSIWMCLNLKLLIADIS